MRLVLLSDTHCLHEEVVLPDGDVLIHAGDFSGRGDEKEFNDFYQWYIRQPHKHKIFVAGNHDWFCFRNKIHPYDSQAKIHYLEDSSCVINGIKFYGSPWQPEFCKWAFNLPPYRLEKYWDAIPYNTDVLITHCPPQTILDSIEYKEDIGCNYLLERVQCLSKESLKLHVFGHVHHSYGIVADDKTTYVNASICTEEYEPVNKPIIIDI